MGTIRVVLRISHFLMRVRERDIAALKRVKMEDALRRVRLFVTAMTEHGPPCALSQGLTGNQLWSAVNQLQKLQRFRTSCPDRLVKGLALASLVLFVFIELYFFRISYHPIGYAASGLLVISASGE